MQLYMVLRNVLQLHGVLVFLQHFTSQFYGVQKIFDFKVDFQ